jgi:MscS family membrane protein
MSSKIFSITWTLVFLWLLCPVAWAQPTPTPLLEPSATSSPVSGESPPVVAPELANPRATVSGFLQSMLGAGPMKLTTYRRARLHLDLTDIPSLVREEKGVELSSQLFEVLQAAQLDLSQIPDTDEGELVRIYRQPSGDEITVSRSVIGEWRFSRQTVQVVPRMYAVLSHKGKIDRWTVPTWLDFTYLHLSGLQWLLLAVAPLVAWSFAVFCIYVLRRILCRRLGLTLDQLVFLKPARWTLWSVVCWLWWSAISLPQGLLVALAAFLKFTGAYAAVICCFGLCDVLSEYVSRLAARTQTTRDDMLVPLMRRAVKVLILVAALLFIAQNLEIEVWSLFAGFSIVGAMVALAGQETVKNFFGSFTILVDRPFSVGDWITVEGVEGVVEDVGFRSTRIRTFYDSVVTVPNSRFITASVDNYGARQYRRYTTKLNLHYATPLEQVESFCEGIRELIRSHPMTRKDNFQVWVNDLSSYSLQVLIYVFWQCPDWGIELQERHRLLMDMHGLARRLDLHFAYPTQTVEMQPKD